MANHYKNKTGRYCCFGYAIIRYEAKNENDLTGVLIADMVLQILAYVAQIERENIKQRQKEGICAARQRGVVFGRPRKDVPENFWDIRNKWQENEISSRQAARALGIAQSTFFKMG